MSAARERDHAMEIAKTDHAAALGRARRISAPWYRAQALAGVARFAPEAEVVRIAVEAVRAASEGEEAYRQVAAAAWAVRALAERGQMRKAAEIADDLAARSSEIEHPVSRMDALFLLWQAARPLDLKVRRQILGRLIIACKAASSWRAGRTLADVVLMTASEDASEAERIVEDMPEGRYRRQAQRQLAAGLTSTPRAFFW